MTFSINTPLRAITIIMVASFAHTASAHGKVDITNNAFSAQSVSCADHIASYNATAKDINNNVNFKGSVEISVKDDRCYFKSNAIPNHDFNDGKVSFRNDVSEQNYVTSVTTTPVIAAKTTPLSLSSDNAIFLNGVKLDLLAAACYGEGNNKLGQEKIGCRDLANGQQHPWRYDPLSPFNNFGTDTHDAHAQPDGSYHYHGGPKVLFESACVENKTVSAVIGFAADGFPIHGACFNDNGIIRKATSSYQLKSGKRQKVEGFTTPDKAYIASDQYDGQFRGDYQYTEGKGDLDVCNGMTVDGHYGYYVTESYPWVLGCFKGTPDASFSKRRH